MEISPDLAKEVLSIVQGSKDFIIEQAPDLVQQIIAYNYYINWFYLFICILMIGSVIYAAKKAIVLSREDSYHNEGWILIHSLYGLFVGFGSFIFTLGTVNNLLLLHFAPKIFLIEYLSRLIK